MLRYNAIKSGVGFGIFSIIALIVFKSFAFIIKITFYRVFEVLLQIFLYVLLPMILSHHSSD